MSTAETLTIASINMAHSFGDFQDRYARLPEVFHDSPTPPRVIALQEVSIDPILADVHDVCEKLGPDYRALPASVYPTGEQTRGALILTDLEVKDQAVFRSHDSSHGVQVVELDDGSKSGLVIANAYLEAEPWHEPRRMITSHWLAKHLKREHEGKPQIILGDFNAMPWFPCLKLLKCHGFESAHVAVHGREPSHTYPTNMTREQILNEGYSKRSQVMALSSLARALKAIPRVPEFGISESGLPQYVIDHMLYRGGTTPIAARQLHDGQNGTKPISDHVVREGTFALTA